MGIAKISVPVFLLGVFTLAGCGSSKEVSDATGYENVERPCEEYEESTNEQFRAMQNGTSPDMSTSRKMAIQSAKSRLAGNLKSKVKTVGQSYIDQKDVKNKAEFKQNWQEMNNNVVKQTIREIEVVCEQVQKKEGKESYRTFVAIQMPTESLKTTMKDELSKREKLRLEYDKQKFEETFEKEMDKLDEGEQLDQQEQ